MVYKKNPKFLNQIQYCERESIPFMVVIGEEEKVQGGVKIRDVQTQKEVYTYYKHFYREEGWGNSMGHHLFFADIKC